MNDYVVDRGLPASIDAERSILGAIFLDNACIAQAECLTTAHFSLDSHRRIYKAILSMWGDGVPVDLISLAEFMRCEQTLEAVGGYAYIASLTDGVPPRANIEHYVRIVTEKAQLRAIINVASKAITKAIGQMDKPSEILEEVERESIRIASETVVKQQEIFLDVTKFIRQYREDVEWRVDGVIEVGTNGTMIGMSGDGKSPLARGLAVCLASGAPWLDMAVRRARTALVSREDYAGTTARFIRRFIAGNGIQEEGLGDWLWISSRAQVPSLFLDNPSDLRVLIDNLKRRKIEFCILDVLNVMHGKDENDNSEMRQVLACVDRIRDEVGCQVMLLHHSKKGVDDSTSIAESGRGSSAIAGFAEFKIRIRTEDEAEGIRQIRFKTKAGEFVKPFYWKLRDMPTNSGVVVERTEWTPTKTAKRNQM